MGPIVPLTIAFAAGLALALVLPGVPPWLGLPASLLSAAAASIAWLRGVRYRAAAALASSAVIGLSAGARLPPAELPGHVLEGMKQGSLVVEARAETPGKPRPRGTTFAAALVRLVVADDGAGVSAAGVRPPGPLKIFVPAGAAAESIDEGDTVFLKNLRLIEPEVPRNPDGSGRPHATGPPLFAVSEGGILVEKGRGGFLERARTSLGKKLAANLSAPSALFAEAVVSGRSGWIPDETADAFRRSGLAHLLAVSGLHLSVVALMLVVLLRAVAARIPALAGRVPAPWAASIAAQPLVWLYAFFASAQAPVLRSAIMVSACSLAQMGGRRGVMPSSLALAALILLVEKPENLTSASFLLSFSAVAGIFIFHGRVRSFILHDLLRRPRWKIEERRRWRRAAGRVLQSAVDILSVSCAASLATLPATCFFFTRVPWAGVASNMAAVPLFSFIVLPANLIYCTLLLAGVPPPGFVSSALDGINGAFMGLARICAMAPPLEAPAWAAVPAACVLLAAVAALAARKTKTGFLLLAFSLAFFILPHVWVKARRHLITHGKMTVVFAEVGQGDAILVRTPGGKHLLVDAGPGDGRRLTEWLGEWTRTIDLFVITHGHRDHYGGTEGLLASGIAIEEAWVNPQGFDETEDLEYLGILGRLQAAGTKLVRGPPCRPVTLGGARIQVLSPCEDEGYDWLLGWNDNSIVLHLRYGDAGILLTGDIETDGERKIAPWQAILPAQVVKVPHHGSAGASGEITTGWKGAKLAVVTAGKNNPFGFPRAAALEGFKAAGIEILRVDRDGAWTVVTDGKILTVHDHGWKRMLVFPASMSE